MTLSTGLFNAYMLTHRSMREWKGTFITKTKKTHTHKQTIQLGRTMCEILLDIVNNINFFFQEYVNKISNYTGY